MGVGIWNWGLEIMDDVGFGIWEDVRLGRMLGWEDVRLGRISVGEDVGWEGCWIRIWEDVG